MVRQGPPDNWRSNLGWEKGVRIGDLKTDQAWVTHFIPQHDEDVGAGIEFLGVDFDGNIYAGEVSRRRLVRYVLHRPSELLGALTGSAPGGPIRVGRPPEGLFCSTLLRTTGCERWPSTRSGA